MKALELSRLNPFAIDKNIFCNWKMSYTSHPILTTFSHLDAGILLEDDRLEEQVVSHLSQKMGNLLLIVKRS